MGALTPLCEDDPNLAELMATILLPRLPILLCSAPTVRPDGEATLYDAYLAEPFDVGGLLAAVGRLAG